jgi:hypothetical protein
MSGGWSGRPTFATWTTPGRQPAARSTTRSADVSDFTESLACEPDHRLLLRARGWPLGEALVEILVKPIGPSVTEVTIREAPSAGPGRWLDNPILRLLLRLRNRETLRRLTDRVEHRAFPLPS